MSESQVQVHGLRVEELSIRENDVDMAGQAAAVAATAPNAEVQQCCPILCSNAMEKCCVICRRVVATILDELCPSCDAEAMDVLTVEDNKRAHKFDGIGPEDGSLCDWCGKPRVDTAEWHTPWGTSVLHCSKACVAQHSLGNKTFAFQLHMYIGSLNNEYAEQTE